MRRVILNVVKNLKSKSWCTQILRFALDDIVFYLSFSSYQCSRTLSVDVLERREPFRYQGRCTEK